MMNFIKKPIAVMAFILILGFAGAYFYFKREVKPAFDIVLAKRSGLVQEVNVTGRVKPGETVELAFEKGGKISRVYVQVGEEVKSQQVLVAVDDSEIAAQLVQAQAAAESARAQLQQYQAILDVQKAKLAEIRRGTRTEEIQLQETKVSNGKVALEDAKNTLFNVKNKAEAALNDVYNNALTAAQKAVIIGKTAVLTVTDIQNAHFSANDPRGAGLADAKTLAVKVLLGADNAGHWSADVLTSLEGGAFAAVQNAVKEPTYENIDRALLETGDGLEKTRQTLNLIPISSELTSAEKTAVNTEKNNISTEIINISAKQQAIAVQTATNASNIASAQENVTSAQNVLAVARDELVLKQAGATREEIAGQEAQVKQAEANVTAQQAQIRQAEANTANIRAQIAKTIIRAPISGAIIKQEAKTGEIVAAGRIVVGLMSVSRFEIEANVPEADIAKINIGQDARLTLDAYGKDIIFGAKVVGIDPAETIIDGVATYKVIFQFVEKNVMVRSGMTADIDIATGYRDNVIVVPQRALTTKNRDKIVQVFAEGEPREVKVKTGLRGSDGNIEIIEGVNEGDKVIISNYGSY